VEFEHNPRPAELSHPLVAADPGVDPHRLVRLCCQHAGAEPLRASLLIAVDDESQPWSESTRAAERLLNDTDVLLGAAGIHLEEVVITDGAGEELREIVRLGGFDGLLICAAIDTASLGVLPLAARLAREHGLEVIVSGGRPNHLGWLRRVVGPLFHWPRPSERAA
jgi:nucleotide-binding universal stress UspA family protein